MSEGVRRVQPLNKGGKPYAYAHARVYQFMEKKTLIYIIGLRKNYILVNE